MNGLQAWTAAIGFQLQLYFDFSGYADMAVGLGRLFNVNLPINFDSPYRATDRYDLWRRWHITFAQFMRAYVFVPLQKNKIIRLPGVAAMVVTVFLSGIWHGLGWTFLLGAAAGRDPDLAALLPARHQGVAMAEMDDPAARGTHRDLLLCDDVDGRAVPLKGFGNGLGGLQGFDERRFRQCV